MREAATGSGRKASSTVSTAQASAAITASSSHSLALQGSGTKRGWDSSCKPWRASSRHEADPLGTESYCAMDHALRCRTVHCVSAPASRSQCAFCHSLWRSSHHTSPARYCSAAARHPGGLHRLAAPPRGAAAAAAGSATVTATEMATRPGCDSDCGRFPGSALKQTRWPSDGVAPYVVLRLHAVSRQGHGIGMCTGYMPPDEVHRGQLQTLVGSMQDSRLHSAPGSILQGAAAAAATA